MKTFILLPLIQKAHMLALSKKVVSRGKSTVLRQFWLPMECVECLECVTSLVNKVTQRVFLFSSICVNIVLFSTHKGVITSNDVREKCLECHMTSNDVKGECYITMMTGKCVNKPDQTEPVCDENNTIFT